MDRLSADKMSPSVPGMSGRDRNARIYMGNLQILGRRYTLPRSRRHTSRPHCQQSGALLVPDQVRLQGYNRFFLCMEATYHAITTHGKAQNAPFCMSEVCCYGRDLSIVWLNQLGQSSFWHKKAGIETP